MVILLFFSDPGFRFNRVTDGSLQSGSHFALSKQVFLRQTSPTRDQDKNNQHPPMKRLKTEEVFLIFHTIRYIHPTLLQQRKQPHLPMGRFCSLFFNLCRVGYIINHLDSASTGLPVGLPNCQSPPSAPFPPISTWIKGSGTADSGPCLSTPEVISRKAAGN